MQHRAVVCDFYGTLAEIPPDGPSWEDLLAEEGYLLPPEVRRRYWDAGIDGVEHDEHSHSRDHYVAWQRARSREMLVDCGVPVARCDDLIERMHAYLVSRPIVAYDEVRAVLGGLRDRGITLAICSNWDWDLLDAVARAGLDGTVDVVVSSAWVGARKPHPRIYARTLEQLGIAPDDAVFVGDTWTCDVEGPLAVGLRPVYLRRPHFGPDHTAPPDHHERGGVWRASDLHAVLDVASLP